MAAAARISKPAQTAPHHYVCNYFELTFQCHLTAKDRLYTLYHLYDRYYGTIAMPVLVKGNNWAVATNSVYYVDMCMWQQQNGAPKVHAETVSLDMQTFTLRIHNFLTVINACDF
jgi:hypothetical protein